MKNQHYRPAISICLAPARGLNLCWLRLLLAGLLLLSLSALQSVHAAQAQLQIGSKRFTESYILGEILRLKLAPETLAEHRQGLGNTAVVLAALQAGSIDIYPDYTGTINFEVLKHTGPTPLPQMQRELAQLGLGMAVPLGFNNSYALAMREPDSQRLGIRRISDLLRAPQLRLALSPEFFGRNDGWPALAQRYALPQQPRVLENGIAYEALAKQQVDLIDVYATSSQIGKYGLRVLIDDLAYFPRYDAVLLYRLDLPSRYPQAWASLQSLQGAISDAQMRAMNAQAELQGQTFSAVAAEFLATAPAASGAPLLAADAALPVALTSTPAAPAASLLQRLFDEKFWTLSWQHLTLVFVSVALACVVAVPLGILAAYRPALRQLVMGSVGVLQTVPALALLTILIALLGQIGLLPALLALFVYALLPIVRNSCTGILQVPNGLRAAGLALGLNKWQRLRYIELPLALPTILAGIKTAAVLNVGSATIAAFIGAGGYGERIVIGLAINDQNMMLAGAIPAAALALLTQLLFELAEKKLPGYR
ncbi:glycine betaine ABC transporter substrate-binding protein [Undibacterium sp.]|uniref:glycine betaine ABC transporter substrate-binding protein n=1 Tax=Undibacterium sp. TaxID=1914977 RepID=UPI0025E51DAE|nr:glycine betaine ABC transporter substrate-binding protein [Undibacterium sp.]